MRAQLIPTKGGKPHELKRDLTVIGRKEDCDILLDHQGVSKYHCVVVKTSGLLLIRDLASTNGTHVNGQRVRRAALLPNDQIKIAGFQFRVFFGPDAEAASSHEHTQPLEPDDLPFALPADSDNEFDGDIGFDIDKLSLLRDEER